MPEPPALSVSVKLALKSVVAQPVGPVIRVVGAILSIVQFQMACQPAACVALSDLKRIVSAPPEAVIERNVSSAVRLFLNTYGVERAPARVAEPA